MYKKIEFLYNLNKPFTEEYCCLWIHIIFHISRNNYVFNRKNGI